jgi:hypothetical protein
MPAARYMYALSLPVDLEIMRDWEILRRLSVTRGSGLLAPSFPPLLQTGGVPFPAPPRAIRRGNGRPQRATASPASAAHRVQHQLLPLLEKLVSGS